MTLYLEMKAPPEHCAYIRTVDSKTPCREMTHGRVRTSTACVPLLVDGKYQSNECLMTK